MQKNMQKICKIYRHDMHNLCKTKCKNMQKICQKYAKKYSKKYAIYVRVCKVHNYANSSQPGPLARPGSEAAVEIVILLSVLRLVLWPF